MDWTIEQLSILAGALITIISFAKDDKHIKEMWLLNDNGKTLRKLI